MENATVEESYAIRKCNHFAIMHMQQIFAARQTFAKQLVSPFTFSLRPGGCLAPVMHDKRVHRFLLPSSIGLHHTGKYVVSH